MPHRKNSLGASNFLDSLFPVVMMTSTEDRQRCSMYCKKQRFQRWLFNNLPLMIVLKEYEDQSGFSFFFLSVSIVDPFSTSLSHTFPRWQIATVDVSRCRQRLLESPRRGHRPRKKPPGIGAAPASHCPDGQ